MNEMLNFIKYLFPRQILQYSIHIHIYSIYLSNTNAAMVSVRQAMDIPHPM